MVLYLRGQSSMVLYLLFYILIRKLRHPVSYWGSNLAKSDLLRSHSSWTGQTNHLKQPTWEDFCASVYLSL